MARGNRREPIFRDREDRLFFLKALGETCGMTGWRVHAWVLMTNHDHLMIETPQANLVAGMTALSRQRHDPSTRKPRRRAPGTGDKWLQNTCTRRFHTRHRLWGRLFGDRYSRAPRDRQHKVLPAG